MIKLEKKDDGEKKDENGESGRENGDVERIEREESIDGIDILQVILSVAKGGLDGCKTTRQRSQDPKMKAAFWTYDTLKMTTKKKLKTFGPISNRLKKEQNRMIRPFVSQDLVVK